MEVRRGDIFLADLSPVVGTEERGIRPVLVIQSNSANDSSPHTIIAPFTTKIRKAILPSHVLCHATEGGLQENSVVLREQIRVIDKRRLIRKLGRIEVSEAPPQTDEPVVSYDIPVIVIVIVIVDVHVYVYVYVHDHG